MYCKKSSFKKIDGGYSLNTNSSATTPPALPWKPWMLPLSLGAAVLVLFSVILIIFLIRRRNRRAAMSQPVMVKDFTFREDELDEDF